MRIVQVNQSDIGGGGFIQPLRLHRAFRQLGHESFLVVLSKQTGEPGVIPLIRPNLLARAVWRGLDIINSRGLRTYPEKPPYGMMFFNLGLWVPDVLNRLKPDVTIMNFINCLMTPRQIAGLKSPLFWTMHDFSPFTGGCHLAVNCDRYRVGCGECPAIGSTEKKDITVKGYAQREGIWGENVTGVAVSPWQAECAKASVACRSHRIEMIPNGIPLDVFYPQLRNDARERLGIGKTRFVIMLGTSANHSYLKGGEFAEEAAKLLSSRYGESIEFISIGNPPLHLEGAAVRHFGFIKDESEMADLYAASDLLFFPSLIEMCPLTVLEAMACGTPVVAFDIDGCKDIITNGQDGWLVKTQDAEGLTEIAERFLNMSLGQREDFRKAARRTIEARFNILDCARSYLKLFSNAEAGADD